MEERLQIDSKEPKKKVEQEEADQVKGKKKDKPGLALSFSEKEVKNLFFNYLTAILLIEGLIFFFCFIDHLASKDSVFPWKAYLFATFLTPVAITFVFGLILLLFNGFFFGHKDSAPKGRGYSGSWHKGERIDTFVQLIHQLPLLLCLFLLIVATALAYKLEDVLIFVAQAGVTTGKYLFFTLIGILVLGAIAGAVWVALNYRLKTKSLKADHQYRMQLMERMGMAIMDDGSMVDKQGRIVYQNGPDADVGALPDASLKQLPDKDVPQITAQQDATEAVFDDDSDASEEDPQNS